MTVQPEVSPVFIFFFLPRYLIPDRSAQKTGIWMTSTKRFYSLVHYWKIRVRCGLADQKDLTQNPGLPRRQQAWSVDPDCGHSSSESMEELVAPRVRVDASPMLYRMLRSIVWYF